MDQIDLAVVVPQWARVFESPARLDQNRRAPIARGVGGSDHVNSIVGVRIENVEFSGMKTNGGRPHAAAVLDGIEMLLRHLFLQGMANYRPIHQILGMQNRQTGHTGEGRRHQIVIVTDAGDVGI